MTTNNTPRIYVADLAAYNAGHLHGVWIDADQSAEEIAAEVATMIAASPVHDAEEALTHDYDGDWHGCQLGETANWEQVASMASMLAEHGPAWGAYVSLVGEHYAEAEDFQDSYCGEWGSEQEYAEDLADNCFEIPENVQPYFDYEKFARDLFMSDYRSCNDDNGQVHVFRSC